MTEKRFCPKGAKVLFLISGWDFGLIYVIINRIDASYGRDYHGFVHCRSSMQSLLGRDCME